MAEDRFIIEHKDGRRYSVTRETFGDQYKAEGFKIVGPDGDAPPEKPKAEPKADESK